MLDAIPRFGELDPRLDGQHFGPDEHVELTGQLRSDCPTALQLLDQAVERGFYPHGYLAVHCPFLASLRGRAEFHRIAARAAERVAVFNRDVGG